MSGMELLLDYLSDLERHNDRAWYQETAGRRREAAEAFEALLAGLLPRIQAFDDTIPLLSPRDLTFKLVRDTRFSHDKSPYNPAFRAHIGPRGKLPVPVGYYLCLRPGGRSFLGGGLFADMFRDATALVRDRIAAQGGAWAQIVEDPAFQARFSVGGTKLKNVPRGYDPAHPQAEYLKHKSWYLEVPVADGALLAEDFPDRAEDCFRGMQPFNAFLNEALAGFQMPDRPR